MVLLLTSCIVGLFHLKEVHPKFRDRLDIGKKLIIIVRNIRYGRAWNYDGWEYDPIRDAEINSEATGNTEDLVNEIPESKMPAFTNQVILQIVSSAILGFVMIAALAMIPILLATPTTSTHPMDKNHETPRGDFLNRGGFGLDTTRISNILLFQAVASIFGQFLAVPTVVSRKGALLSYRIGLVLVMCVYVLIPVTASFPNGGGLVAILTMLALYALSMGLAITCSAIL